MAQGHRHMPKVAPESIALAQSTTAVHSRRRRKKENQRGSGSRLRHHRKPKKDDTKPPPFRFMDLPYEIRCQILEYLVWKPGLLFARPKRYNRVTAAQRVRDKWPHRPFNMAGFETFKNFTSHERSFLSNKFELPIFLVSRQVSYEASICFYNINRFLLRVDAVAWPAVRAPPVVSGLDNIHPKVLPLLRSVVISVAFERWEDDKTIYVRQGPALIVALEKMGKTLGECNLRQVELKLLYDATRWVEWPEPSYPRATFGDKYMEQDERILEPLKQISSVRYVTTKGMTDQYAEELADALKKPKEEVKPGSGGGDETRAAPSEKKPRKQRSSQAKKPSSTTRRVTRSMTAKEPSSTTEKATGSANRKRKRGC